MLKGEILKMELKPRGEKRVMEKFRLRLLHHLGFTTNFFPVFDAEDMIDGQKILDNFTLRKKEDFVSS